MNLNKLSEFPAPKPDILSTFKFLDQTDETVNWKTYTNPNFKFTVKYPPDWASFQIKNNTNIFIIGFGQIGAKDYKGDPFSTINIVVKEDPNPKLIDLEKISETAGMEDLMGSFKVDKYVNWSDTTVDGIKAKRAHHLYCQSGSCHNVLFIKDSKIYGITINQGEEDLLKIFDEMTSTFKFLN